MPFFPQKENQPDPKARLIYSFLPCVCDGLYHHIHPCGHTGGPCAVLVQPAELLTDMVRALTVQKRDGTILHLQMHDVVPYLVQLIMILRMGQGLGNAVTEIHNGL